MVGRYNPPMPSPVRRWLPVLAWMAVIYTTIPFVRVLREWFVARWDPVWIGLAVATVLVAAAGATVVLLRRRAHGLRRGAPLWIIGVTTVMVLWTFSLRRSPEEAVHFLEYGVLAILLHRALRPTMPNDLVFIAAALIGAQVGTVDEVIQWISPSRTWDWRDLVLNGGAGALAQVILWRAVSPWAHPWDPRSLRIVLRLTAVQLLFLALCLSNTPERVARYAPYLQSSDHLRSSLNPMAEYGHLHVAPGLGSFKSRLALAELEAQDRTRATEVVVLVDGARRHYSLFLDTWPVSEDPFTYEMRVHLFARDRNLDKAREHEFSGALAREQLTVAWFENRLLEEFFTATLIDSAYVWNQRLRLRVESAHDPDYRFRSAAGSHLITFASERSLRLALLLLVAVMIVADLRMGQLHGRQS
jgi:hypothetical protein